MTNKARTYLTRIKAATNLYDLQEVEISFKQDMSINCDDLGKLCRAADDKRYTLRNNAESLRLKDILFQRTKAEMDAYHDMSHKPESWTAEDPILRGLAGHRGGRACRRVRSMEGSQPQRITHKGHTPRRGLCLVSTVFDIQRTSSEVLFLIPISEEGRGSQWLPEAENRSRPP